MADMRFTDIAVNLTDAMFQGVYRGKRLHPPDLAAVLDRALARGVRRIVITGTDLPDSRRALELARAINRSGAHPGLRLFSTVGLHPTQTAAELEPPPAAGEPPPAEGGGGAPAAPAPAPQRPDAAAYEAALLALARDGMTDGTVVFVGECGLDGDRLHYAPLAVQLRHFPMHLRLARATGLPLFLHDRASDGALLRLVAEGGGLPPAGGVVHSFTGTPDEVEAILAVPGLRIGLNGCGLKTPANLAAAARIPLSRLLLETDAPWCGIKASSAAMAHVAAQGGAAAAGARRPEKWDEGCMVRDRNEPCAVLQVAEVYAALTGAGLREVAEAAEKNADELLGGRGE
jgi:TatD DNase family protein